MPDRFTDKESWSEVRKETDCVKKTEKLAELGYAHIMASDRTISELENSVKKLEIILTGNGDPSHSVLARIDDVEAEVINVNNEVKSLKNLILGDIEKAGKDPSLLERLRNTEKVADSAIKLAWLVIGAVIAQIILAILNLL